MRNTKTSKSGRSGTSNIQKFAMSREVGKSGSRGRSSARTKSKGTAKAGGSQFSLKAFANFFRKDGMVVLYGVILMLFSLTLLIAMVSYFFNAANNATYVESLVDDGAPAVEASNWLKGFGAFIAYYAMTPFGVFSIGIPVLLFLYSMRIICNGMRREHKIKRLGALTFRVVILMFFLSFTMGMFSFKTQNTFLAGVFGNFTNQFLHEHVGALGLAIVDMAFLSVVLFLFQDSEGNSYLSKVVAGGRQLAERVAESSRQRRAARRREGAVIAPVKTGPMVSEREDLDDLYISDHGVLSKEYSHSVGLQDEDAVAEDEHKEEIPFEIVTADSSPDPETTMEEVKEEHDVESETDEDQDSGSAAEVLTPDEVRNLEPYDPRADLSLFEFPPIDLLLEHPYTASTKELMRKELLENKNNIEKTLLSFGIAIKSISAVVGPTVTLYEIVPKEGVRISKIKSLEDDIALSLAALGIRIIAPIPGRGTIGIEVPNKQPEIVSMRDIITSDKFRNNSYALPIGLGKTINNEAFVVDLAKMPHLLVAGATGQGKSVGLNAIITSLLYTKHPSEMKFVLVDPKKVEFTLYSTIENYYLASIPEVNDGDDNEPIITDTKKVVRTLNSLCLEMDNRYDLLKKAKMRNLKEYNAKFCRRELSPAAGHRYMPYIVVVIDEFGDLIMTAGREVEQPLARLAQLARAIGIHLVIATQRPSVNIITGSIKANFPARIAFRVQSGVDSKTILDATGANQLIGKGDMLISTGSDVVRLQCAFVDTPEVEKIAEFIGEQSIERPLLQPYELPFVPDSSEKGESRGEDSANPDELDDLIVEAATLIVQTQQGSTSSIQRKMSIGYNRAGRIMDQLEDLKIVGPGSGSKPRQVLIKTEADLRQHLAEKGLL